MTNPQRLIHKGERHQLRSCRWPARFKVVGRQGITAAVADARGRRRENTRD